MNATLSTHINNAASLIGICMGMLVSLAILVALIWAGFSDVTGYTIDMVLGVF